MFYHSLKQRAIEIRKKCIKRYDTSYHEMKEKCDSLYSTRKSVVSAISDVTRIINSISNKPKSFDTDFGKIGHELDTFTEMEVYAKQEFDAAVKAGIGAVTGSAAGAGIVAFGPNTMIGIATAFGKATTGRAISTLSGYAAKKAAIGWIGRTVGWFAVKQGSGYLVGKTILALCGPIGWAIGAASTGGALASLTENNKKIADSLVDEAKEIETAREAVDECSVNIQNLEQRTQLVLDGIHNDIKHLYNFECANYVELNDDDKYFLGSVVNKTLTLSQLLNETIT